MSGADLTLEFLEGGAAANEGRDRAGCPYLATSNAADAWHAGFVFHSRGRVNDIAQVTRGRGERLNLWPFAAGDKIVATVRWNDPGDDPLPPVTFDRDRDWTADMRARHKVDPDRQRIELELRLASPKRADAGKAPAAQADAGHLPLFVAANEPSLF